MYSIKLTTSIAIVLMNLIGTVINVPAGVYDFPNPTIEVYKQGGFKVSIPDEDGLSLFAFHGNVNRPLRNLEAGQFSVDITKKENNRWTYENSNVKLKRGDVINYWLYVIKNGLGYQLLDKQYTVTDFADEANCTVIYNRNVVNCNHEMTSLEACMKMQSNILDTLVVSQNELVRLQKKINPNFDQNHSQTSPADQPESIAFHSAITSSITTTAPNPDVTTYKNALLLGGNLPIVQPSQKNYIQLINFILWEKLGLHDIDTVSVTPYGEETYVFELVNTKEKQRVLDAGKIKLNDSTIYIRNFEK